MSNRKPIAATAQMVHLTLARISGQRSRWRWHSPTWDWGPGTLDMISGEVEDAASFLGNCSRAGDVRGDGAVGFRLGLWRQRHERRGTGVQGHSLCSGAGGKPKMARAAARDALGRCTESRSIWGDLYATGVSRCKSFGDAAEHKRRLPVP